MTPLQTILLSDPELHHEYGRVPAHIHMKDNLSWAKQRVRVKRMIKRLKKVVNGGAWYDNMPVFDELWEYNTVRSSRVKDVYKTQWYHR